MKNKFLLLLLTVVFTSCTDETNFTTNDEELNLKKTITYTPTKAAYDNGSTNAYKNVQYYQNNHVVADSTYNSAGTLYRHIVYTFSSNSREETRFFNGTSSLTVYTFDDVGRIIKVKTTSDNPSANSERRFEYTANAVTSQYYDHSTGLPLSGASYTYPLNAQGLITTDSEFDGDKMIKNNLWSGAGIVSLEYYDVLKPANMLKNIHELNNLFFESGEYRVTTAEENNYYLKGYHYNSFYSNPESVSFESTFNTQGYILYSKGVGYVGAYQADRNLERFYYYE